MKKINRTVLFIALTFVLSFSLAGLYKLLGGEYEKSGTILGASYMFIPMISAIIVEKVIHRESLKRNLFISFRFNKWFFIAWLLPLFLSLATLGISLLSPGVTYSPEMTGMMERFENLMTPEQMDQMRLSFEKMPVHPFWITLVQALIAGITINAVAGFGEESGWRGFLLKEFKEMNFIKAALIIGLIWGIWHFPLILMGHNYPQHPVAGVFMMIMWCIMLSPLFLYITIKAKSVIAAAILHGSINATAGLSIMVINGGNDLTVGLTGLTGFITLFIFLILLFIYDNRISMERIITNKISDNL
jgi:uncharacterized protein